MLGRFGCCLLGRCYFFRFCGLSFSCLLPGSCSSGAFLFGGAWRFALYFGFSVCALFSFRASFWLGFLGAWLAGCLFGTIRSFLARASCRGHNRLFLQGVFQAMCGLNPKTGVLLLPAGGQIPSPLQVTLTGRLSGTAKMLRILVPYALRASAAPHLQR